MPMIHRVFPSKTIDHLTVEYRDGRFVADTPDMCGSPFTGIGDTVAEAVGGWLQLHATDFGLNVKVSPEAQKAARKQRSKALRKRDTPKTMPTAERARMMLEALDGRVLITRTLVEDVLGAVGNHHATFSVKKSVRTVRAEFNDGSVLLHSFGDW